MSTASGASGQKPRVLAEVWTDGNQFESERHRNTPQDPITKEVELNGLPPDAKSYCGEYVCIHEETPANLSISCPPFPKGGTVTSSCFDRRFAYHTMDTFIRFLKDTLGFDVRTVKARVRKEMLLPIPVFVNVSNLDNAYFSRDTRDLTLGDGRGVWHFASDGDINIHELTHWLIYMINPLLGDDEWGDGNAIHEGVADAFTALYFGDPEIAEDAAKREGPNGSASGLRTAENTAKFQDLNTTESHEVGKIYSQFFWSIYRNILAELEAGNRGEFAKNPTQFRDLARNSTMLIILAHLGNFAIPSPTHADFVDAVLVAVKRLSGEGLLKGLAQYGVSADKIRAMVRGEEKECGFDWMAKRIAEERKEPSSLDGVTLGEETLLAGFGGETRVASKQFYQTKKRGKVQVLGAGFISAGKDEARAATHGIRELRSVNIDEEIKLAEAKAKEKALAAIKTWQNGRYRPEVRRRIIAAATAAASSGRANGRLAIPPKKTSLAWSFRLGPANVLIDAKTGEILSLYIRWIVD